MALVFHNDKLGKICTKCKQWYPIEDFRPRKQSRDGYNSLCKHCLNENCRAWRAKNKERVAELNRMFYQENRQKRLEYHRSYRQKNKDYFKEAMKKFKRDNPSYSRNYNREWSRANPEKINERSRKRRARRLGNGGAFTAQEWHMLKQHYKFTCLCCRRQEPEIQLTVDHVIPLSKGGRHSIENIQPLCRSCNSAKHDDMIDYRPQWQDDEDQE